MTRKKPRSWGRGPDILQSDVRIRGTFNLRGAQMPKSRWHITCTLLIAFTAEGQVFAKSDKHSPFYPQYLADPDYTSGRTQRTLGVTSLAVLGGIGVGTFIVGAVQNTCAGSFGDSKERCRKNAEEVMLTGVIITTVGLGIGLPFTIVGSRQMAKARKRIEEEQKPDQPGHTNNSGPLSEPSASKQKFALNLPLVKIEF